MTAQDLKNSILQLAVQGKLVPQDPNDEPASELLKRIKAEKELLIKEGKIKKEKKLPEITEEDVQFDIPASWRWLRLGDFCAVYNGDSINATVKQEKYSKPCDGWDFIATKDVGFDHVINYQNGIRIPFQEADFKVAPAGSVLLCMEGGSAGKKIGILDRDVCFGNKLCCFTPITVHNTYLYYYLQCPQFFSDFMGSMTGLIGGVGAAKLKNIAISIPPIAEQQRIVERIEELMPLVEEYGKLEEQRTKLDAEFPEKLRKSILQQAIQGKLTERDPADEPASELLHRINVEKESLIKAGKIKKDRRTEELGIPSVEDITFDIPLGWECAYLGGILNKLTDGTHKTPKYTNCGVKFVSVKDMSSGVLSLEKTKYISEKEHNELYLRCDPMRGDMLLSKVGTTGVPAIVDTDEPFSLFVSVALLKYNHSCINEQFFYYLLQSPLVQEQAEYNTRGAGNKNWVLDAIAKTIIVIPPLAEQQRIVDRLNELLALCDELK